MRWLCAAALVFAPVAAADEDPRCRGTLAQAARAFCAAALPQQDEHQRYAAFVEACALPRVVELTRELISFRTVSAERPASQNPEIAALGRHLRSFAQAHGMSFRGFAHQKDPLSARPTPTGADVFELSWGQGAPLLGLVFHGDVVPAAPEAWSRDPFAAEVVDGKLYGRGAQDDKGPLATALVGVAMAHALGLKPRGRVLLIVGNGEESDWTGMRAYVASTPKVPQVISVDAGFPVVAAQSGFVSWHLQAPVGTSPRGGPPGFEPLDVRAGEFLTQVPARASLRLAPRGLTPQEARSLLTAAIAKLGELRPAVRFEVQADEGTFTVVAHGRAVHSAGAEAGHNALWDLAALASRLPLREGGIAAMLQVVAQRFDGDHHGHKLGLHYSDQFMGPLMVAPTVLRVEEGTVRLSVNMRRPRGRDRTAFEASLLAAAGAVSDQTSGRVTEGPGRQVGDPHVADPTGPLVRTLLEVYRRHTGQQDAAPKSIRGGTYARLFEGAVDFGPSFPSVPYTGHAADEFIRLTDLARVTQLLADALYELAVRPDPS
jgi:dipeptidase D